MTNEVIWTPGVLKQYVDQRFLDSDKAVSAALQAAKEAVGKAEQATDKRFDQQSEEADRRAETLAAQIKTLEVAMYQQAGSKQTARQGWALIPSIVFSTAMFGLGVLAIYHP